MIRRRIYIGHESHARFHGSEDSSRGRLRYDAM